MTRTRRKTLRRGPRRIARRRTLDRKPKAIDLFCGCGGLTVGLKKAGFNVVAAVDVDKLAVGAYQANHPEPHVWRRNIRSLSASAIRRKLKLRRGELALLAGCPPCQGFSGLRTLKGSRRNCDRRNGLIRDFLRLIKGLRPKAVMMENVPELAKSARFAEFRTSLEKLGYKVAWDILDAQEYGVPQRRRRLVLLAGRGAAIAFARKALKTVTVGKAIHGLPRAGRSGDPLHDHGERRTPRVSRRIARIPKNGGSRSDLPRRQQLRCHKRCNGFKDVYGRMAWSDVAPTITGGCFNPSKGRFLHPTCNRAITLREAALLQTFPKRYRFPNVTSKTNVALLIGNALPPEFIRRHALRIYEFIRARWAA